MVELIPNQRVVLAAGPAELHLDFAPGSVTLTHTGLSPGDELEGVCSSWRLSLAQLAHYCERHADENRAVRWLVESAHTSHETAHVFFTDKTALASWLGSGTGVGETGSSYSIVLGDDRMSGRVLANTPGRDLALSWSEDGDSVLFLRTLPHPAGSGRLIVFTWSRWGGAPLPAERAGHLERAHRRLAQTLDARASA